jgi:hypothetical protein
MKKGRCKLIGLEVIISCLILSEMLDGKIAGAAGNIGYGIAVFLIIAESLIIISGISDKNTAVKLYSGHCWHWSLALSRFSLLAAGYFVTALILVFVDLTMFSCARKVNEEANRAEAQDSAGCILVRIIQQDGCQAVSCAGAAGARNSGLKCPFYDRLWRCTKGGRAMAAKSLLIVILLFADLPQPGLRLMDLIL